MTQTTKTTNLDSTLGTAASGSPERRGADSSISDRAESPAPFRDVQMTQAEEYALWLAAGVSPELLKEPVESFGPLLRPVPAKWRFCEYHIRIEGIPVRVDIDADADWKGEEDGFVGTEKVTVRGDCPTCFYARETQDNEWTIERRGYCGEQEVVVCECGNEYPLHHGLPDEMKGGR